MSPPALQSQDIPHTPGTYTTNTTATPPPHDSPQLTDNCTPQSLGYTNLPLPDLIPTDICLLSHNINTLHTTTTAELGITLDLYNELDPTIIGLQECN
jgi:hypothetical protein